MERTVEELMSMTADEIDGEQDGISEENFADMLDAYDYASPKRGQMLKGVILRVSDDVVLVDVGLKRDGVVPSKDLDRLDESTLEGLEVGKEVLVYVLRPWSVQGDLIVSINKALEFEDWERASQLLESGEVVGAEVVGTNKGGVLVQFGRLRSFVPQSHLTGLPRGASFEKLEIAKDGLLGQNLRLKVIDVDQRRDRLVMSERAARHEARKDRLEKLQPGEILTGQVVNLVNYGAFVDIGGVDGLVHVSELAWERVEHPGDVVEVGQELEVQVKSIDVEHERISLSRKAMLANPWDSVSADFSEDDLVHGRVTNVVDFGAFVELANGLEGLVHASQMSTYAISEPGDLVRPGDELVVRILKIDHDRERIALSLDAVTSEEQLEWMKLRTEEDEEAETLEDEDGATEADTPDMVEGAPEAVSEDGEDDVTEGDEPEIMEAESEAAMQEPEAVEIDDDTPEMVEGEPEAESEVGEDDAPEMMEAESEAGEDDAIEDDIPEMTEAGSEAKTE